MGNSLFFFWPVGKCDSRFWLSNAWEMASILWEVSSFPRGFLELVIDFPFWVVSWELRSILWEIGKKLLPKCIFRTSDFPF